MFHSSDYFVLNNIAPLPPTQSESTLTMAPWSGRVTVMHSEAVCGAVRHPVAVHEAPNPVRTHHLTSRQLCQIQKLSLLLASFSFFQARSGADYTYPLCGVRKV